MGGRVCSEPRLGPILCTALALEGVNVVINGRDPVTLEAAAADIRQVAAGVTVLTVVGSVTDPDCRAALVSAHPQVDILVNNAGGPRRVIFAIGGATSGFPRWTRTCSPL